MRAKKITLYGEASIPGIWIYVAKVSRFAEFFIYVGKTGRIQEGQKTSPLSRLLGHLSDAEFFNCLQHHVEQKGWSVDTCHFELWCYGPLEKSDTGNGMSSTEVQILAQQAESALTEYIDAAGYTVLGSHEPPTENDEEKIAVANLLSEIIPDLNSRIRIVSDLSDDSSEDDSSADDFFDDDSSDDDSLEDDLLDADSSDDDEASESESDKNSA